MVPPAAPPRRAEYTGPLRRKTDPRPFRQPPISRSSYVAASRPKRTSPAGEPIPRLDHLEGGSKNAQLQLCLDLIAAMPKYKPKRGLAGRQDVVFNLVLDSPLIGKAFSQLLSNYDNIKTSDDLNREVTAAFPKEVMADFLAKLPPLTRWAFKILGFTNVLAFKIGIWFVSKRFILARDMKNAAKKIAQREKQGIKTIVCLPGEAVEGTQEARQSLAANRQAVADLCKYAPRYGVRQVNFSLKLTNLTHDLTNSLTRGTSQYADLRFEVISMAKLFQKLTKEHGIEAVITIDAEEDMYRSGTVAFFQDILASYPGLAPHLQNVTQSSFKGGKSDVEEKILPAALKDVYLSLVRLVKGAYVELEREWFAEGKS
ncbi:MAG: proline dehydrogenase family protein, partial [bacterium]